MAWSSFTAGLFTAGQVLTAAQMNTYVRDNLMAGGPIYATTAARDVAIPTPYAGQRALISGTNVNYQYNGTAWVSPQTLTVPPSCSVYFGTTSTYTQDTDIVWTAQDYTAVDTMWVSGANITTTTAGLYLFTFTGRATNTVSNGARAAILISGTTTEAQTPSETTTDFRWSLSLVRSMTAAQTVQARVQWSSGVTTLQGGTDLRPTLTGTYLGKIA